MKQYIYTKSAQIQTYNDIKSSSDRRDILFHIDCWYADSYKNVQKNKIWNVYFEKSILSIFWACCYTRILEEKDTDGLKKKQTKLSLLLKCQLRWECSIGLSQNNHGGGWKI